MDIMDEPASERLLKASAVTATEPLIIPANNFPKNSSIFRNIPVAPHRTPYLRRTSGVISFSCMNIFVNKLIILVPPFQTKNIMITHSVKSQTKAVDDRILSSTAYKNIMIPA